MARLRLTLLGGFEARSASGARLDIPIRKAQGLLAYLALQPGKAVPREKLAGLLWSERGETQAQGSLRQTLTVLRKALAPVEPPALVIDRNSVALDPEAVEVDAVRFLQLIDAGDPDDLEAVIGLYQGDLLDGFAVRDPAFEAWLEAARRQLRESLHRALTRLLDHHGAQGDRDAAIAVARRLLALDPLQEAAHRALMRLYAETGRREAALQQFGRCRDLLAAELGIAPEPETEALYRALRDEAPAAAGQAPEAAGIPVLRPSPIGAGRRGAADAPIRAPFARWPVLALALVLVAAAGALAWLRPWEPKVEPASVARMAYPLPEQPSIAVLPFANLSGDPEQAHFADGLAEDIITILSKIPTLFVIARNSTFTYRDKPVKVQRVAEELGVRFVLEGSVRRAEGRVRVTAQLIDALGGNHLWSGRYDRDAKGFLALQDDIAGNIVRALQIELTEGEMARVQLGRGTGDIEAWASAMRGHALLRRITKEDVARGRQLIERAIALDPDYATAWSFLAWTHLHDARFGWSASRAESFRAATAAAKRAIALDDSLPDAYAVLGAIELIQRRHDPAIADMEKAVALEPNGADHTALLAWALTYAGRPAEAAALLEKAMRLSPYYPAWYLVTLGRAYRLAGRYDDAIAALERAEARAPTNFHMHVVFAVILSELGRLEEARAKVAHILRMDPNYTIAEFAKAVPYKDPAEFDRIRHALRRAGLPG
jgi:TolB-like protein/DNA-binding SARP family transcriptional activator/cytochrome c-type biogenesis protein CcmH/NrfG